MNSKRCEGDNALGMYLCQKECFIDLFETEENMKFHSAWAVMDISGG